MVKKAKRGQEEIVGFVLIVVIVAVLAVILLGFSVRKNSSDLEKGNKEIRQFLESSMEFTTNCTIGAINNYGNIGDLIKGCNGGESKSCSNSDEKVCKVLNKTMIGMIDTSWPVGEKYAYKGYIFESAYFADLESKASGKGLLNITKGNCTKKDYSGDEYIINDGDGSIINTFSLCF